MAAIEMEPDVKLLGTASVQTDASCGGFTISSPNLSSALDCLCSSFTPSWSSLLGLVRTELCWYLCPYHKHPV